MATGSSDGRAWQQLELAAVFHRPLAGVAIGPRGWVAAEQVEASDGSGIAAILFWSGDGRTWERLADQADLGHSFAGPMAAGAWGYAMLGQAIDAQGTSFPAVWVSTDGRAWREMPPGRGELRQVVVVDDGVLALGYGTASFTTDGAAWLDAAALPGSDTASSMLATTSAGSDVLVALAGDGAPHFVRGRIDSAHPARSDWHDAGLAIPANANVTSLAEGPLGAVVLGFDRATLRAMSWSSRDLQTWHRTDLDASTFGGGAPALLAAGNDAFVALASDVNDFGIVRARAWTSTDGVAWNRSDTDALGVFPGPPSAPCPSGDSFEARALIDLASTYRANMAGMWPHCFGNRQISLRGFVRLCECGGTTPYASRPGWLIDPLGSVAFWLNPSADTRESPPISIEVQIDPRHAVPIPRDGAHVRITGHFEDPASKTCRLIPNVSVIAELAPAAIAIATCRQTFVVASITVLT